MTTRTSPRGSARDRLLAAAGELFYEEGVHTVGIDRVIERAGVEKAPLYKVLGSKDELIWAYLMARHEATKERMDRELARYETPRERLLGVFEVQGQSFAEPGFRGCAFVNASAEANQGSRIREAADHYREWVRELFEGLATDPGAADPAALARQLVLLYDGAGISARMDRDPATAEVSRAIAAALVNAALGAAAPPGSPPG